MALRQSDLPADFRLTSDGLVKYKYGWAHLEPKSKGGWRWFTNYGELEFNELEDGMRTIREHYGDA